MSAGKAGYWLAILACVVVAVTVVAAIRVMGPPSVQRQQNLDSKRAEDLARIDQFIDSYVERTGKLPPDLATVAHQPGLRLSTVDPLDASAYAYEITGDRTFRLCAVFATDTAKATLDDVRPWPGDEWSHGVGRQCFDRNATKSK